jgi:hypothetical protein
MGRLSGLGASIPQIPYKDELRKQKTKHWNLLCLIRADFGGRLESYHSIKENHGLDIFDM